ncbi:MAG: hypothetical protein PVG90_00750 [Bacillota bacterium]|jgi:hypothetical protein
MMECSEQVSDFCQRQKSITMALGRFLVAFMDGYRGENRAEREILAQCYHQLFRKYYFSTLNPEIALTPANIVSLLCEREFGPEMTAAPVLECTYKGKRITRMQCRFVCLQADNHPLSNDMRHFLEAAGAGLAMVKPGILSAGEYVKLPKSLWIPDRHYINILGLIACEARYLELTEAEGGWTARTAARAEDFFSLTKQDQLLLMAQHMVTLCSKKLTNAFPDLRKEFSVLRIMEFLRNPKSFETTMETLFKKMGLDLKKLEYLPLSGNFEEILQSMGSGRENIIKLFKIEQMLDIYFFTPFGYYFHLIRQVYPEIYDLAWELSEILDELDNLQAVRNKLFSMAGEYELTPLGERLQGKTRKPRRVRAMSEQIGDAELLQAVLAGIDYPEEEPDENEIEDLFQFLLSNFNPTPPTGKGKKAKVLDFPLNKGTAAAKEYGGRIFVFKVKLFYAKRIWRQIEIRGTDTLHDLHGAIYNVFEFDEEHLYAFFLSNKFWDQTTEYAHPRSDGSRPANKAVIGRLGLSVKQKIAYVFDFGTEQRFEVELVAVHDAEPQARYPREVKRNKPAKTVCDVCGSGQNPLKWYCEEYDLYLCEQCAQEEKFAECYLQPAIL